MTTTITLSDNPVNTTYQDVTGSTAGAGTGAIFDVTKIDGVYTAVVCETDPDNYGLDYVIGDTIIISGSDLGGQDGVNDLIVTVASVGDSGEIENFGLLGVGQIGDGVEDINVFVDGTLGVDTFVSMDTRDAYTIENVDGVISARLISDAVSEFTIKLTDYERVQFADSAVAFDLSGNTGMVYSLLAAGLGQSDVSAEFMGAGIYFSDLGMTIKELAQSLLGTNVYQEDAGGVSDETFVKQVWENVYGTPASLSDINYVLTLMHDNHFDQADILVLASQLTEFQESIDLVGMQTTGIDYIVYSM